MAFEKINKNTRSWGAFSGNRVSIQKSHIHFSKEAMSNFLGAEKYVEIFLDRPGKRVGFRETKSSISGFKISKDGCIGLKLKNIVPGIFEVQYDPKEKILIAYGVDFL
jgi:hypothetical protein